MLAGLSNLPERKAVVLMMNHFMVNAADKDLVLQRNFRKSQRES